MTGSSWKILRKENFPAPSEGNAPFPERGASVSERADTPAKPEKFAPEGWKILRPAFTLFEMTVALGIFSFVALAVMAVFISSLRIHRQSSAARGVIDNVRFALEFMEREMRTGRQFKDVSGVLEFVNDRGKVARYRAGSEAIERFNQDNGLYERLTAEEVIVSGFGFQLAGETAGDTSQPRITIFFKASARRDSTIALSMETTVSQRDLDFLK